MGETRKQRHKRKDLLSSGIDPTTFLLHSVQKCRHETYLFMVQRLSIIVIVVIVVINLYNLLLVNYRISSQRNHILSLLTEWSDDLPVLLKTIHL